MEISSARPTTIVTLCGTILLASAAAVPIGIGLRFGESGNALALCVAESVALSGVLIALWLAARQNRRISAAADAARRIAAGEFGVALPPTSQDTSGRLAAALTTLRDNLRNAIEREVAAHRSAQALLASAVEREAQLHGAKEQAEAADRMKTEFLARMSHELRTPLSAIIGFSEMIAHESYGPIGETRYREFAEDILHSGRHLLAIINDILDIAKLQSGTTTLRLQHVVSRGIVDEAVRIVRKKAEQAAVSIDVAIDSEVPVILGDQLRLRQVLLNLLSNAIKFTPAGGRVQVTVAHEEAAVAITVSDTGIGMAEEDIPRALQPFVQVDSGPARYHDGTGLGLPLSKLFVELHGGSLAIRSQPGRGTSVTIALPSIADARPRIAA